MKTIGFLYRIENIALEPFDDTLQITQSFVIRDVINLINEKLQPQAFKVDEHSLKPVFMNNQFCLEGLANEIQQPKTVGFLSGR